MLLLNEFPFSNIKSNSRLSAFMQAKIMKVTDHPKIGRTRFATSRPIKEAIAVPMNNKEYTLEPSLSKLTKKYY